MIIIIKMIIIIIVTIMIIIIIIIKIRKLIIQKKMNKKKRYNCYEIIINLVLFRINLAEIRGQFLYSKAKTREIALNSKSQR